MIYIYTTGDFILAVIMKDLLGANGIPCILRNDYLGAGLGEIPPVDYWPEIWVTNDSDAEPARELIAEAARGAYPAAEPWRCTYCGEEMNAVFIQCRKCGQARSSGRLDKG